MEEKFSERKPTRVKRYDYSKAGAYFVTICVQDRKPILSEIIRTNNPSVNETNNKAVGDGAHDVPSIRLTPIGKIVEKNLLSSNNIPNVEIDSYVIMPDHIHLLLFIDNFNGASRTSRPTNAASTTGATPAVPLSRCGSGTPRL